MDQQDMLKLLEGKECSVISVNSYKTPSRYVKGVYVGTETLCLDDVPSEALVLMYRDWREIIMVDAVLLQDRSLEISDRSGQLQVRYTTASSSKQLTKSHENYEALRKLVDEYGL